MVNALKLLHIFIGESLFKNKNLSRNSLYLEGMSIHSGKNSFRC